MRSCSFVKFQALVVTIECFKCDELSRPLCQMQLNFDVFDHFLEVKVAEIFWGAGAPQNYSVMFARKSILFLFAINFHLFGHHTPEIATSRLT